MIPPAVATFLKGYAMGAANVIPGVSGGTVAFITGIFETLVNALKSFDASALQLLINGRLREFWAHIHGNFLLPLGVGVLVSAVSLAKLLTYLFEHHPILIWAFFFGLILASAYYVGRTVERWRAGPIIALIVGLAIAVSFALIKPTEENPATGYLILCGVVGICSMIIPGLSGSFVLILMGNYMLILDSVRELADAAASLDFAAMTGPLKIFVPVAIGAAFGLLAFSHLVSWLFRKFRNIAVALLTGFVAGSLLIIWPWKTPIHAMAANGEPLLRSSGKQIVEGYEWFLPSLANGQTWAAIGLIVLGAVVVILMESFGDQHQQ